MPTPAKACPRVAEGHAAIVQLSEGDLGRLRHFIEVAKRT